MPRRQPLFVALCLVALAGLALWANRSDPAAMRIDYRPGAYFPPGFPLHGEVKLLTPPVVEMGKRHHIRIEYVMGDLEIGPGESIEIWKHFTSDVEEFQVDDSDAPAYFGAETTAPGVEFEPVIYSNSVQRNKQQAFPYRKTAGIIIREGTLKKGDKVYFDLGGPKGVRMQFYAENLFNFRIAFTHPGEMKYLGYGGDAYMKVTGGPLAKLKVQAPSIVGRREPFTVEVVPLDAWGSLAKNYQGLEIVLESDQVGVAPLEYDPALQHYVAENVLASKQGVARIRARTADGRFEGVSNPIWVEDHPVDRVYYGDLHQHAYLHDGRGVPIELYLNARRVALLDFGAVTPHQTGISATGPSFRIDEYRDLRDNWPLLVEGVKVMKDWEGFVPILGYEYSVGTRAGGHHNVIYADDEAPTTMQLDPAGWRNPVGDMMKTLRRTGRRALVIPHIGGGPPDWEHETDPGLERNFEIASVHGVFEESYQKHLESGQRLSATASADNHTVGFGNSNPGLIYTMTNPLTAVFATEKTREAMWQGFLDRRTFGVTDNARLLMDFRVNGEPMGGELPRYDAGDPRIEARVSGTSPIVRVDLLKNSEVVHSTAPARDPSSSLLRVVWGDNIYQRRANTSIGPGELRAEGGRLTLKRALAIDNSFEEIVQSGPKIAYRTATTSNDRDGMLVDVSQASGDLIFRREDAPEFTGVHEVRIPMHELKRSGYFSWRSEPQPVRHSYLEKMGVEVRVFLEAELVRETDAAMDVDFSYEDRRPMEPGDYYYLRVEQLDTAKAWSSPVWAN